MILYVVICAFFIYFIIRIATAKRTETVTIAFAGAYDGNDTVAILPKDRNQTIYTEGETLVNLSEYDRYLIRGHSLEKVDLPDGVFVYARPLGNEDVYSICNHFVIIRYDNERLAKEHPEITNPVEGFKARKVVTVLDNHLAETKFKEEFRKILASDSEITDVDRCLNHLWSKYKFASLFYQDDQRLMVSITYKDGVTKDYSFHSFRFLSGVVRYRSIG